MSDWASGDAYEPYVGRWSRLVAEEFVRWLDAPPGADWVDVGCGTGALTSTILRDAAPRSVTGVEPSPAFAGYARAHVTDPRARFMIGDARALPLRDATADVVVSGLVLNFVPDVRRAVADAVRVVRPGGTVASYVWDYAGEMALMRYFWTAAAELDPAVADMDEGTRFPLCHPEALAEAFGALGDVETTGITVPTVFRDFDDYWTPFLGGTGVAPAYVAALDADRVAALREALRERLPAEPDGSIRLAARAWAVRGRA